MRKQLAHCLHGLRPVEGVTSTDLRHAGVGNPSQCMSELRDAGYEIVSTREQHPNGHWHARYVLTGEPAPTGEPWLSSWAACLTCETRGLHREDWGDPGCCDAPRLLTARTHDGRLDLLLLLPDSQLERSLTP